MPRADEDRSPTTDEAAGMAWWNNMSEAQRADVLRRCGCDTVAAAWACEKVRRQYPDVVKTVRLYSGCMFSLIERPGFLCLIDLDQGGCSLTHEAALVVAHLRLQGFNLDANRVIYRDTMLVWDELLLSNSAFVRFRSIHETDLDTAIAKARRQEG